MLGKLRNRKVYKYIMITAIMVLVISMVGCKNEKLVDEEIVAKVDGEAITKNELYDLMVEQYGTQALDSLIGEKIVNAELEKQKIEVSEEDIETELNKIKQYYESDQAFTEAMAYYGYTLDDIKKDVTMNIQIKRLLGPNITIGEEDISSYFEQNKTSFDQKEEVRARHILVKTEDQAKEIKEKISAGEDFAQLAKEHSTDEMTKESGGDLGFFGKGKMVKEFEEEAFGLRIGEISNPVKTDYGYHIIKVEEKKEAKEATLEEHKDEIKDILVEAKLPEVYQNWYQEKYDEYKIENYLIEE
ncbi:peptidylprolyl isomerase [uncultured Tissierella sp.]|jgi:foldase protein PrsA|uniref:peptidylprolyl isomerase n=1 Tax=uncultured Tissierella sp. TaxID=448160 RepID=UPI0028053380|nr:peptidylprolyl isomerase [uncultured Tissierella sp.]MDU5081578.1 peptidylprolyl isomerase [Bacillota bacterium]